ncbi:hypothetical protein [Ectobacillus panaciterrae]|uniref:hypothetical protein n=1 Tax=Ectobacillus panaciterrae TaxID=363872 RepID=UPI000425F225|nr:hypothetical protein [Ectobacillus panaciterrae]
MTDCMEFKYIYQLLLTLKNGKEIETYDTFPHSDWEETLSELHFRISEYKFNRFGHRLIRSSEIAVVEIVGMGIKDIE